MNSYLDIKQQFEAIFSQFEPMLSSSPEGLAPHIKLLHSMFNVLFELTSRQIAELRESIEKVTKTIDGQTQTIDRQTTRTQREPSATLRFSEARREAAPRRLRVPKLSPYSPHFTKRAKNGVRLEQYLKCLFRHIGKFKDKLDDKDTSDEEKKSILKSCMPWNFCKS